MHSYTVRNAQTGSKLSPTIAKAARNWLLWEDAIRLAETDRRSGRYAAEHADGFIRADEVTRTYVPWLTDPVGMITVTTLDALAAALRTEMNL